jgi:hypothetical protein
MPGSVATLVGPPGGPFVVQTPTPPEAVAATRATTNTTLKAETRNLMVSLLLLTKP